MSKRRGKVLMDPESVERRNWYASLQKATMDEVAQEKEFLRAEFRREQQQKHERTPVKKDSLKDVENDWIMKLNSYKDTSATVICFPGIGQGPSAFHKWRTVLQESGIFLCTVCMPGRLYRVTEPCAVSARDAAISIFLAVKEMGLLQRKVEADDAQVALNRPLVFLGHDVGCMVAYEVAKLLQDYNYLLAGLVMSAAPSPYQQGQNRHGKKHCYLSDNELLQRMIELGGAPSTLLGRKDLLKRFLPMFRSDYFLYDKYVITPPANVLAIDEDDIDKARPSASALNTLPGTPEAPSRPSERSYESQHSHNSQGRQTETGSHAGSRAGSHPELHVGSHATSYAGSYAASRAGSHTGSHAGSHASSHVGSPAVSHPKSHIGSHVSSHVPSHAGLHTGSHAASHAASHAGSYAGSYASSYAGSRVSTARGEPEEEQEGDQEELVYPVVLYRLHCEVVTLLAAGDPFVSPEEVEEWVHMANTYEHVQLAPSEPGCHTTGLWEPENQATVLNILRRLCGVEPK